MGEHSFCVPLDEHRDAHHHGGPAENDGAEEDSEQNHGLGAVCELVRDFEPAEDQREETGEGQAEKAEEAGLRECALRLLEWFLSGSEEIKLADGGFDQHPEAVQHEAEECPGPGRFLMVFVDQSEREQEVAEGDLVEIDVEQRASRKFGKPVAAMIGEIAGWQCHAMSDDDQ